MENALEPPGGSKYGDNPPQFLLDAMMVWLTAFANQLNKF